MIKEFTTQRVYFSNDGSASYKLGVLHTWIYDEDDMVYYRDDVDDAYFMEVPHNGDKAFSLKLNTHARLLVNIIK